MGVETDMSDRWEGRERERIGQVVRGISFACVVIVINTILFFVSLSSRFICKVFDRLHFEIINNNYFNWDDHFIRNPEIEESLSYTVLITFILQIITSILHLFK